MTMYGPEDRAKELLDMGYEEVTEAPGPYGALNVGQRVHHVGQQYSEARAGTATIERIFIRHSRDNDVEVIAKRDKPIWGPNDTHGYWANYHTIPAS